MSMIGLLVTSIGPKHGSLVGSGELLVVEPRGTYSPGSCNLVFKISTCLLGFIIYSFCSRMKLLEFVVAALFVFTLHTESLLPFPFVFVFNIVFWGLVIWTTLAFRNCQSTKYLTSRVWSLLFVGEYVLTFNYSHYNRKWIVTLHDEDFNYLQIIDQSILL